MARGKKRSEFGKNIIIVGAGILVGLLLDKGGAFDAIIQGSEGTRLMGTFVAGLFFTSFLTTAPAIIALGNISLASSSIVPVALVGGVGAMVGDLFIFFFLKDTIAKNAREVVCHSGSRRIAGICTGKIFRVLTPVLGALIIASPFPDELGLSLLGFSKIPLRYFLPISFTMNTLGIVIIGLVAKALV